MKRKIGMIVAVEISALMRKYADKLVLIKDKGFKVYSAEFDDEVLYIAHSGAGEIKAAAATQVLIDLYDVELIVNYGVVGALTEEIKVAQTCIVEKVVHYDFDTSAADNCEVGRYFDYDSVYLRTTEKFIKTAIDIDSNIKKVVCASGDKFIADETKKTELSKTFNADICDMESAAIVLVCLENDVPHLLIKTVSDSIKGGATEFRATFEKTADVCIYTVDKIISSCIL